MTALLVILCVILIGVVAVQIGRVTELAAKIRGEEEVQELTNSRNANISLLFVVGFLVFCIASAWYYKNWMLGYGPHDAASVHGASLDSLFNVTLFFTGIVFVITQIALFYFAWKYKADKNRKSLYMPHDNKLEIIWTAIPAVVMTFLVISGLDAWNEAMGDIQPGEEYMEIEATGAQFLWYLRYPGPDGKLGARDYTMIDGLNPLGQVWTDRKNIDDFQPTDIVLPVGKQVRVRITARDVLHNFYLPHFRVKMDAIPGLPTYFVFTPTKTTEEYRQQLKNYPEYQAPSDPDDPESDPLWKSFEYELACAELCGSGHFSMRKIVKIVTEEEYEDWLATQKSYFLTSSIRGSDADPYKDELFPMEAAAQRAELNSAVDKALAAETLEEKIVRLKYVKFETGSARLTKLSRYQLNDVAEILNKKPNLTIEFAGHTDSTGNADANLVLSQERAQAVYDFVVNKGVAPNRMTAVGYGPNQPIDDNGTEEGRAENRRTEFRIITQ